MQLDSKVVFPHCFFFLARRATIGGTLVVWQKRLCNVFGTHTLRKMNGDHHYIVAELVLLDVSAFLLTSRS